MRHIPLIVPALVAVLCLAPAPVRAADQRPNIIFIMVDDMGRDWVSCYHAAHRTPHIDRLAAQGIRFTTAWSLPICTPTRCQLLTGRYPFRTGWVDHHDVPRWGGVGLDPKREVTFAGVLKQVGYATAIGGKWQINDLRKQPNALAQHGFDEHCVWVGFETGNPPSAQRYWDAFLQTNGDRRTHAGKFGPDIVNAFLIDFIRRHKTGPFLVYYPMILTHGPFTDTPANHDNPPADKFAGMVDYADELVGRIVAAVDELGIRDNTVIMFTTDNGSPKAGGRLDGVRMPAGKGKLTEAGVHEPFIVSAPKLSPGSRTSDAMIDFSDILPTLADLAGAPLPPGVTLDGRSFAPVIRGQPLPNNGRQWIFAQRGDRRVLRDKRYKVYSTGRFYDLQADPHEQVDLARSDDPTIVANRTRLQTLLDALPPNAPPPFEGFGHK